jgi:hypothetical protein
LARSRDGQRRHRQHLLTPDSQGGPARDQDVKVRTGAQQGGQQGRRRQDVLEVVQDQQQVAGPEMARQQVDERLPSVGPEPDRLPDRESHQVGIGQRREADEDRAVPETVAGDGRHGLGKACLAHAGWACEREQPSAVLREKAQGPGQLGLPTDERGQRP